MVRCQAIARLLLVLLGVACADPSPIRVALAEQEPLWELGLGVSWASLPDYLGSDERKELPLPVIPFPHIRYRGKWLAVDREAVRARLFRSDRVRFELSLSAQPPVDSDENDARRGMPDLDWTGELGPKLVVRLYESKAHLHRINFEIPVRGVFSTDFSYLDHVGWTSSPGIAYTTRLRGSSLSLGAGTEFADTEYSDYVYGVHSRFATPTRAAYRGDGGYGGVRFSAGVSRRTGRLWYGAFTRYFNLAGASFAGSPLVRTQHAVFGGVAVAWVFMESDQLVETGPEDSHSD